MREIKFRAWDKKSGKYRSIDSMAFHGKGCFDNNSQTIKVVNLWGEDIIEQKSIICHRESQEVAIEQFTGLIDANGKEIYEGDIIEWANCSGMPDGFAAVIWENDSGAWYVEKDPHFYDPLENVYRANIIGNIHENSELLEATT